MTSRISTLKNELDHLETLELMLDSTGDVEELDDLTVELREAGAFTLPAGARKSKSPASAPLGPRRFVSSFNGEVLAGRSARSNEEVTFKIARPDELWFHAKGSAGAHVVLRRSDKEPPSRAEIEEAAGVAAYFSKSRGSTHVEVVYTLRKNVRKIRGAPPGTVRLADHQSVRVRPALPESSVIGHQSSVDVSPRPVCRSLGEGGPSVTSHRSSVDSNHQSSDEKDES
jgi:predicted ribosome quality control (RQC) complex YloA/Tae2 family protein